MSLNALFCIFRGSFPQEDLLEAKQAGFSDRQLAGLIGVQENDMRNERIKQGVKPWVKQVSKLVKRVGPFVIGCVNYWFKDGACFCYCTYVLRISRWSKQVGFLNDGAC